MYLGGCSITEQYMCGYTYAFNMFYSQRKMRKNMFEFSKKITSEKFYKKLSKEEKETLEKFKDYLLISASEERSREALREILRFREIIGKEINNFDLDDLRYFLKELKLYNFADLTKNKIKAYIQQFIKWMYKDWSAKFNNLEDIHFNSNAQRKNEITSEDVLTKEEIEKLMVGEKSLFYQTFFIVQYEAGLRTIEARKLKWSDVLFEEDEEFCSIQVSSKKNRNRTEQIREIPLKLATPYLRKLKEQQKSKGIVSKWVFPSPQDPSNFISKQVNNIFKEITTKVLGKSKYNYLLRHSRGTELQRLVKQNQMSKDNATEFLGHSEKMFDKVYSHMSKDDKKKIMKKQLYDFKEITPEKKHDLELEIEKLKKRQEISEKRQELMEKVISGFINLKQTQSH
jgi:integrase